MLPFRRVLCPVDFSAASLHALRGAGELAQEFGAELCALHIVPLLLPYPNAVTGVGVFLSGDRKAEAQGHLDIVLSQYAPSSVRTFGEVKVGYAVNEIAAFATREGYDLIVMAPQGQGMWNHPIFGSVAEGVLQMAPCSVLIIPKQSSPHREQRKTVPTKCTVPIEVPARRGQLQYVYRSQDSLSLRPAFHIE